MQPQSLYRLYFLATLVMVLLMGGYNHASATPDSSSKVFVFDIKDKIDPRMSRRVELALDNAREWDADIVIIHMDTFGGAVNDADKIRKRILEFEKPIWVFIDKNAASAGALISIACDSIYMTPGASIGAATVVNSKGDAAPDKYQSYMRSIMRSTAESNGRDPRIAEAMVDEKLEVDTISPAGQVITFSTSEAMRYGYCEGEVNTIEELLKHNGITNPEQKHFKLSGTEQVISFFLNPFISSILILLMLGGIYFELQSPGVGFPLAAAAVAAVLYFIPYYLNGLAANWEIACFVLGMILLALELLVIPGFGIAGISGLILTLGSMVLIMVNNDFFDFSFVPPGSLFTAVTTLLAGLLGFMILLIFGGVRISSMPVFQKIALQNTMSKEEGYTSRGEKPSLEGKTGVTYTVLRPSGKVMIDDQIYDAYTRGEYIDKQEKVEVIADQSSSLKVRKLGENA